MTDRRGRFITFEGGDGCGKTTQLKLLAARLREMGWEVVETVEPGGTRIGMEIRKILLDPRYHELCPAAELLLYFAARAQNFEERILPAWQSGAIVLSDRFTDSTLAYQGAGRGLGRNVVMKLHNIACHGLQPDLTLLLDIDLETSLNRVQSRNQGSQREDRMDSQSQEFHDRVRQS
ncbi:MAG: dTMP kinase, partial [Bryobacteraceae bacterium]